MRIVVDEVESSGRESSGALWREFVISVSLVILLAGVAVFAGVSHTADALSEEAMLRRARAHFKDIVLTRRWNARYGGVYVEKRPGIESNPYIEEPDLVARDGRVFTLRNPALMAREISELAAAEGGYQFHITSLKLVNPDNAPDPWEGRTLRNFEQGAREAHARERVGGRTLFRYMAPLYVEEACLKCHRDQGYHVGDVRGGISVSFDITDDERALGRSRTVTVGLFLGTIAALLGIIALFTTRLYRKLRRAEACIREMVVTDELTGLHNRRYLFEVLPAEVARARRYGQPLACVMIDIDEFKAINDRHGHPAGDEVLRRVGERVRASSRASDIVARYGGEEFAVLLPHTGSAGAAHAAEKLRALLEGMAVELPDGAMVKVRASFGIAELDHGDQDDSGERMVQRADRALYRAKEAGRNRVVVYEAGAPE